MREFRAVVDSLKAIAPDLHQRTAPGFDKPDEGVSRALASPFFQSHFSSVRDSYVQFETEIKGGGTCHEALLALGFAFAPSYEKKLDRLSIPHVRLVLFIS